MATRVSDDLAVVAAQRQAQSSLTRLLVRDIRGLRRLIAPERLQESIPLWMAAVRALVGQYGAAAAALSANFYDDQRESAGASGRFAAQVADPPPDEQIEASLRWAAKDLWDRDLDDPATTDAQREPFDVRLAQAEQRAQAVAQKLVAGQGRDTVRKAVDQDRGAVGYARAAALGACSFCRLMASRGMVYKTVGSAGREANERFNGDASVAKFHDNCHCAIIPVFRGQHFELSAHAAEWDRIYREFAAPYPGDQLRRFRAAIAELDRQAGR